MTIAFPSTSIRFPGALSRALGALAFVAATACAAPVALVTDVVGDARNGNEPLRLLAEVEAGRELALQPGTTVVVFTLADGAEWTLTGPGRFRIASKGPEALSGAAPPQRRAGPAAYRDFRLRGDRLQQGGLVLRGRDRLVLLAPVNELVIGDDVTFRWEALAEGTRYQFELVDQAGQKVLAAETTTHELVLPSAIRLVAGQSYFWAVRAQGPLGTPAAYRAAEFRVADVATQQRIAATRPAADAPFSERVLFVALLQDIGAHGAADEARRRLAAERPAGWHDSR